MTPVTFRRYGPNDPAPTVIVERITHWFAIDYNGRPGTEIWLDTGTCIKVGNYPSDVEKAVKHAQQHGVGE